jgi:hypothetical protein
MKDFECAFPDFMGGEGMSLPVYAAINLRVPRSGDSDIDAMILESRRADFMEKAYPMAVIDCHSAKDAIKYAFSIADDMLAEWEKKNEGT